MTQQLIKQPNGKYCVFDSVISDFIFVNIDPDTYVKYLVYVAKQEIEAKIKDLVLKIETGKKPYYQFTMSFEEAVDTIREINGETTMLTLIDVEEWE